VLSFNLFTVVALFLGKALHWITNQVHATRTTLVSLSARSVALLASPCQR